MGVVLRGAFWLLPFIGLGVATGTTINKTAKTVALGAGAYYLYTQLKK